jgi:hypothetical protein
MNPCSSPRGNCPADWPVIRLQQNVAATVTFLFTDVDGAASEVDVPTQSTTIITVMSADLIEQVSAAELRISPHPTSNQVVGIVGDYEGEGQFEFNCSSENLSMPGIFLGTILLFDSDKKPVFAKNCYVEIEQNVTDGWMFNGPLTITEVRLALRDCPGMNFLLDDYEFTETEIMLCIRKPVDYWNEMPPPVGRYNYANFPFRYQWMEATIAQLLKLAALYYARNRLKYSAGNVTVDDLGRDEEYQKTSAEMWAEYKEFVKIKKIEFNMELGWGRLPGGWSM